MTIYFDMDGTIADLYSVPNWLDSLIAEQPEPYINAEPLVDCEAMSALINDLQSRGVSFGIISWLSKGSSKEYDKKVRKAKRDWLREYFPAVEWDEIHIVKYGAPKHFNCRDNSGILFDDNENVRKLWKGFAFDENCIIDFLSKVVL